VGLEVSEGDVHIVLLYRLNDWFKEFVARSWDWLDALNSEQWALLLGFTTVLGFLCLRGMTARRI